MVSTPGEHHVQPRLKVLHRGETQLIGGLLKLSRETHLDETRHDSEQLRRILAWIDEQLICRKFEARLNWIPDRNPVSAEQFLTETAEQPNIEAEALCSPS